MSNLSAVSCPRPNKKSVNAERTADLLNFPIHYNNMLFARSGSGSESFSLKNIYFQFFQPKQFCSTNWIKSLTKFWKECAQKFLNYTDKKYTSDESELQKYKIYHNFTFSM